MASPFFGLTDEYIVSVHQQMFKMERFSFHELYTLPIYKRNFFIRLAVKQQEEERKSMDKARGVSEGTPVSKKEIGNVPGFVARNVSAK